MPVTTEQQKGRGTMSCDLCLRCLSSHTSNILAWSSACRHILDTHWLSSNGNGSVQCGRYRGAPCVHFIFCLLRGNVKKVTGVLTTDMALTYKYPNLSRRGELMSLKDISSACQQYHLYSTTSPCSRQLWNQLVATKAIRFCLLK